MANAQLVLLPTDSKWKLDEDTRRIGRAGLAQARAILADVPDVLELAATSLPAASLHQDSRPHTDQYRLALAA